MRNKLKRIQCVCAVACLLASTCANTVMATDAVIQESESEPPPPRILSRKV